MALKELLVYLDQSERSLLRLRLAAELAQRHSSHLIALYIRGLSPAQFARRRSAELGLRSFNEMERLDHGMVDRIDCAAERLRATLDDNARQNRLVFEWRAMESERSDAIRQQARFADMCIVGQDDPDDQSAFNEGLGETLLLESKHPVLFIPASGEVATLGRNIIVAWDFSRTASAAAHAALPLLGHAESVTVVTINPSQLGGDHAQSSLLDVSTHLHQLGVHAEERSIEAVAVEDIAATLQSKALEMGADLIVAGAYGHARLREQLLGGVTRDLLASMRLPLLMAH